MSEEEPQGSLEITWSDVGRARLDQIHWEIQGQICAAVEHFARTGEGDVEYEGSEDRPLVNLRVHGFVVEARLDLIERTFFVLYLYEERRR